jgi:hypothetical protein
MVPIYSQPVYETRGHGTQVLVDEGGKFLGYQKPPPSVEDGKIDVPKPPEILAKEQELGHELEPVYATGQVQHGSGTSQPVEYGAPIGYRYDNGKSQYVNFDTSGSQTSIQDRGNPGFADFALNVLSMAYPPAAPFISAYRGIQALERGDPLAALAQLAGAGKIIPGLDPSTTAMLKNVSTGAKIITAVKTGDPLAIANSMVTLPGVPVDAKNALNLVNTANAVAHGDINAMVDVAQKFGSNVSKTPTGVTVDGTTYDINNTPAGAANTPESNMTTTLDAQIATNLREERNAQAQEQADREQTAREAIRASEPSGGLPSTTDTPVSKAPLEAGQVAALNPPTDEQIAQEQADREQAAREAARAAEPSGGLPSTTDTVTDSELTLPPVTVTGSAGNNTVTDSALPVSPNVGTIDTNTGVNGNNVRTDSALPVNPNVGTTTESGLTLPPVTVTGSAGNNTVTDSALPVNPNVGTTTDSGLTLPPVTVTGSAGNNTVTDSALPVSPNVGTTTDSGLTLPPVTVTGIGGNNTVTDSALPVSPNVGTTDPTLDRVEIHAPALPPESTDLTLPPVDIHAPALPTTVAPKAPVVPKIPAIPKIPTIPKAPATPAPTAAAPTGALPTTTEPSAPAGNVLKLGKMGSSEMGYNAHLKQLTLPERKELAMQADTAPSDVDLNKALASLAAYAPDAEKDVVPEIYAAGGTVQRFAEGSQPDVQAMIDSYTNADMQSALKNLGNLDTGLVQPKGQMFSLKQVGPSPSQQRSLQQMNVIPQLAALLQSRGMRLAEGGQPDHTHPHYDGTPLFRTGGLESLGGKYVEGKGDGTSDDIAAMLANGEYVFSADVVSALGNGSNKAGAKELDQMVQAIRARARSAPPDKLPPDAKSPLEYLKSSKGKKHG